MTAWIRTAGWAAVAIFFAFFMHNLNAWYIEPNVLGFEDPMTDYAKVEKLRNAIHSVPWFLSGFGHFVSGFAAAVLALAANELFRVPCPIAGRLAFGAGLIAAAGFIALGIASMMGGQALGLLSEQNPGEADALYLAGSLVRIGFNGLAIIAFGWFAIQLSWCGIRTGVLPKLFCWFGYFAGAVGFVFAFAYVPVYLSVYLVYALWLAVSLLRLRASGAG